MPEETLKSEATAQSEAVEQPQSPKSPADDMGSMLARIPGLANYFGAESAAEPALAEDETSSDEPSTPDETPAAEPEGQPEEEPKQDEEKKKEELAPNIQKRIDKIVAQKHAAIEKAEALEAKVKELEAKVSAPAPQVPTPEDPLANVNSQEELSQQFEDAKKVKRWALENLDGGEVANKDGTTEYWDGPKVKRYLAWSEALLTEHIPQRKAYLESQAQFEAQAKSYYPNMAKVGTEENSVLTAWIKLFPAVQRFPDHKLIIMDALAGQKLRLSKAKGAANGRQKAVRNTPTLAAPSPSAGTNAPQKSILNKDLLNRMATDRTALDVFSESLIGSGP